MTSLACPPVSAVLTRRSLTHWQRFREADAFARRALCAQLAPAETAGLIQLERNLTTLPPVGEWFEWKNATSADYRPKPGILPALLSGLTLDGKAGAELVRVCQPTGAAIGALLQTIEEYDPAAAPPEVDPFAAIPDPAAPTSGPLPSSRHCSEKRINTLLHSRITASEGPSLTEHLAELVDRWGVDLSRHLTPEALDRFCQETNNQPGIVRRHLQKIRKARGIRECPGAAVAPVMPREMEQHARSVALAVAESLFIEAENGGNRAALLLEAAALLREVLK